MKKNDTYLLNKGLSITFITNFIDFQTNVLTRENSDRQSIENIAKTVFNEMMNNGDIEFSDWDIIKDKLKSIKYQTKKDLVEEVKKEHIVNMISDVCFNCRDMQGKTISDSIGVENISSFSKENKVSKTISELFALVKYREELDKELKKKLAAIDEFSVEEVQLSLINKYGSFMPENYIKSVEIVFDAE